MRRPTFSFERALAARGYTVIGVDEVGCGCLAGPVVAAAIHLPIRSRIGIVRDSKLLSARQRERIVSMFTERGYRWSIGTASVGEIGRLNIRNATYLAMRRALKSFIAIRDHERYAAYFALVDAWTIPDIPLAQRAVIHGDRMVKSIAAASIVAKVTRDRMMRELDAEFPRYGFAQHKGYGTDQHRNAIAKYGLSPAHRRTFCASLQAPTFKCQRADPSQDRVLCSSAA